MSLLRMALEGIKEPWIGFDLDGTLAHHDEWKGIEHIGEPIPKMLAVLREHLERGDLCKIFTARVAQDTPEQSAEAIRYIQDWTEQHVGQRLEVTNEKDPGMLKLYDDRAVQVIENTGEVVEA